MTDYQVLTIAFAFVGSTLSSLCIGLLIWCRQLEKRVMVLESYFTVGEEYRNG